MKKPISPQQMEEYLEKEAEVRALVNQAQYAKAFALARKYYKQDPRNPLKKMKYAILLGDNQEGLSTKQIEANRKAAVRLLKHLVERNLRQFPSSHKENLLNEYYWFSRQPLKQYQLGLKRVKRGDLRGQYSCGVGASMLALDYLSKGKIPHAKKWGQLSVKAWQKLFKVNSRYYNCYCFLARAEGALGKFKEMESTLKKGAQLAGRDITYSEFTEVRIEVWTAHLKNRKLLEG